jgi:hypothetical protein
MAYKSYNYRAVCDECGFKRWNYELAKRWDGAMVCRDTCWEPRNILDFYRTRNDAHKLPWTRPDDDHQGQGTQITVSGFALDLGKYGSSNGNINTTPITFSSFPITVEYLVYLRAVNSGVQNNVGRLGGGSIIVRVELSGKFFMYFSTSGGSNVVSAGTILANTLLNQWVRVSHVLTNTTTTALYLTYLVNGTPTQVLDATTNGAQSGLTYANPWVFGQDAVLGANEPLNGIIDDFRIWNTVRTPAQILADWNSVKLPTTPGLISNWTFDDLGDASNMTPDGLITTTDAVNGNQVQLYGAKAYPRMMNFSNTN